MTSFREDASWVSWRTLLLDSSPTFIASGWHSVTSCQLSSFFKVHKSGMIVYETNLSFSNALVFKFPSLSNEGVSFENSCAM